MSLNEAHDLDGLYNCYPATNQDRNLSKLYHVRQAGTALFPFLMVE